MSHCCEGGASGAICGLLVRCCYCGEHACSRQKQQVIAGVAGCDCRRQVLPQARRTSSSPCHRVGTCSGSLAPAAQRRQTPGENGRRRQGWRRCRSANRNLEGQAGEYKRPGCAGAASAASSAPPPATASLLAPAPPLSASSLAACAVDQGAGQCAGQRHLHDQPHHAAKVAGAARRRRSLPAADACAACGCFPCSGSGAVGALKGRAALRCVRPVAACLPTFRPPPADAPPCPLLAPRSACSAALQIAQTQAMLANEYGTASNIKSRVNRQSVLAAITSAQQRLKLYTRVRGRRRRALRPLPLRAAGRQGRDRQVAANVPQRLVL